MIFQVDIPDEYLQFLEKLKNLPVHIDHILESRPGDFFIRDNAISINHYVRNIEDDFKSFLFDCYIKEGSLEKVFGEMKLVNLYACCEPFPAEDYEI